MSNSIHFIMDYEVLAGRSFCPISERIPTVMETSDREEMSVKNNALGKGIVPRQGHSQQSTGIGPGPIAMRRAVEGFIGSFFSDGTRKRSHGVYDST